MPYAEGRIFNDSDSHIMETMDWLLSYADPKIRPRLAPLDLTMAGGKATDDLVSALPAIIARRKSDPAAMARAEANILERKSWHALGGFDPDERRRALDLLGYNRQLVFPGSCINQFYGELGVQKFFDPEIIYGGARALNRAMADFCSHDQRMRAVGFIPLDVPELAVREINEGDSPGMRHDLGRPRFRRPRCRRPIPTWTRCGPDLAGLGRAFRHSIWRRARCSCARASPKTARKSKPGRWAGPMKSAPRTTWVPITRSEAFISAMILDGVLEKFPRLRGGVIEQGAMWVIPWLQANSTSRRTRLRLRTLPQPAPEGVGLRASPDSRHAVAARARGMDDRAGRCGDVPVLDRLSPSRGRTRSAAALRKALADYNIGEAAQERFYAANFVEMMGSRAA